MSIFDKSKINEPKLYLGSSKHKSEDYSLVEAYTPKGL